MSALSCVQHKVQVPKGAVSSACSWDRQTGQPGGVELATCSPTKEIEEPETLGRAARQLASLAVLLLTRLARSSAIWPALLPDLVSTQCFDAISVILRNVLISQNLRLPGKDHTMEMEVKAASPGMQMGREI